MRRAFMIAIALALASSVEAQQPGDTVGARCVVKRTTASYVFCRPLAGDTLTGDTVRMARTTYAAQRWRNVGVVAPPQPQVTSVVITPASVTLGPGEGQFFTAAVSMDAGGVVPAVAWSATGGTIASTGFYTRSTAGGAFVVIASAGGKADTAAVTLLAAPTPEPTPTPPTQPPIGAGCQATDLLCEDFEDGHWYEKHCDAANSSGGLAQTDGWCGTIYAETQRAAGTARCGGSISSPNTWVGFRSPCAGTTGLMTGGSSGNMADHALAQAVDELWVRFYTKPLAGYTFGAEKMLTFNDGVPSGAGIKWGNLSWNCASLAASTGNVTMGFPLPMDRCVTQNLGNNLTIQSGNWYFYEVHYKLSTPGQADGVFELWLDNCGPTGTSCPATPTKRMSHTNVRNDRQSTTQLFRVLWFEAWSNPASRGERYWDQIRASKTGPIGFIQ